MLLIGGSFFWAATDYSLAVGRGRAIEFGRSLSTAPGITVFSQTAVGLAGPGVRTVACSDTASAYPFRYDGLVLVTSAGDNLVLVPREWSRSRGVAIVLPTNGPGAVRVEYRARQADPTPANC